MGNKEITSIRFKMNREGLDMFVSTIKDLIKINDVCLLRINTKNVVIYTTVGQGDNISAFKSKTYDVGELFVEHELTDENVDFILKDCRKFERTISGYSRQGRDVSFEMTYAQIGARTYGDLMRINNGKMRMTVVAGSPTTINTKITLEQIRTYADPEKANFKFDLSPDDFSEIKKLMAIDTENDIVNINVEDTENGRKVVFGESSWNLDVDDTDYEPTTMCFPKRYLKAAEVKETKSIYVFEPFILLEGDGANLLIALEFTV